MPRNRKTAIHQRNEDEDEDINAVAHHSRCVFMSWADKRVQMTEEKFRIFLRCSAWSDSFNCRFDLIFALRTAGNWFRSAPFKRLENRFQ